MTRVLPMLTRGASGRIGQLLLHFAPYADFVAYDEGKHADEAHTFGLECLVATLTSVKPGSPLASRVKAAVLADGLASQAASYIIKHLPANMDAGAQQGAWRLPGRRCHWCCSCSAGLPRATRESSRPSSRSDRERVEKVRSRRPARPGTSALMTRLHAL